MTADHDLLIRIDERTAKIEENMATKDYVNQVKNEHVIEHHNKKSIAPPPPRQIDKKLVAAIIAFLTVATLYIQSLF